MRKTVCNLRSRILKWIAVPVLLILSFPLLSQEKLPPKELLKMSIEELMNVQITVASRQKTSQDEAPSIVTVVTAEEIQDMGARNIVDILQRVPGFDFVHSIILPTPNSVIRDIPSDIGNGKIKYMINNHNLSSQFGTINTHILCLPIDAIKQIEIIRGPCYALYGSGAFSGVVNIITKRGGDYPTGVTVVGGRFNTYKSTFELSLKKENYSAYIYSEYYSTEDYKGIIEKDLFGSGANSAAPGPMTAGSENYTLHTNVNYNNFFFTGFFQKMKPELPIGIALALTDEYDSNYGMYFGEAGYEQAIKDKGSFQLKTYYDYAIQNTKLEIFSEETMANVFGWTNGESLFGKPLANNSVFGIELNTDYVLENGAKLLGGISIEHRETFNVKSFVNANIIGSPLVLDNITYSPFEYLGGMRNISENGNWLRHSKRTVTEVFTQGIFNLKKFLNLNNPESLSFTGGLRYGRYSDVGSTVNPRPGLVYLPIAKLSFKLLYGSAYRAPNPKELYSINNPAKLGNEDLKPETIQTTEFQAAYRFSRNIAGNITFFDIDTDNIIMPSNNTFENVDKMKALGLEVELKVGFERYKYGFCNFTYQKMRNITHKSISSDSGQVYTYGDLYTGNMSPVIANIGVNYDFSKNVFANFHLNYVGEKKRSEEKYWNGEILRDFDNRPPVKSCYLLNGSVTFKDILKNSTIQLSGFNLLNSDHRDPDPTAVIEKDMPQEGRNFIFRKSYRFDTCQ